MCWEINPLKSEFGSKTPPNDRDPYTSCVDLEQEEACMSAGYISCKEKACQEEGQM